VESEPERTDYRKIAIAGVNAGWQDAIGKERHPRAAVLRLRAGIRLLKAAGDPVALRLFEFAYAHAFGLARLGAQRQDGAQHGSTGVEP
jgi:hypothetical protein